MLLCLGSPLRQRVLLRFKDWSTLKHCIVLLHLFLIRQSSVTRCGLRHSCFIVSVCVCLNQLEVYLLNCNALPQFSLSASFQAYIYTYITHISICANFFAAKTLSPVISLNMRWGFISYTIRHNQARIFHPSSDLTNTTAHPVKNLSHVTQSRLIHTIYFRHFLKYIISTSSFKIFVGLRKSGSDWQ